MWLAVGGERLALPFKSVDPHFPNPNPDATPRVDALGGVFELPRGGRPKAVYSAWHVGPTLVIVMDHGYCCT